MSEKKTETSKEGKKAESFYSLLKEGKIRVGSKVGFTPQGAKAEKVIKVDKAFLELKLKDEKFYEKYKYNVKE